MIMAQAVVVTRTVPSPYVSTALTSDIKETDMEIWLHVLQSSAQRILALPPDTKTYHTVGCGGGGGVVVYHQGRNHYSVK